ncbi:MAG: DUF2975 domain-containing protein [Oscillospiraceae bacterium]|nr:DUF2975 domain-containing protein [Oscillospiraceae bacterium]MDD4414144.1 DUF2975 domain-containing protein [Oscillospiraceae bacterium]
MRFLGKSWLSLLIEYTLTLLMLVALVLTISLPWSIPAVTLHKPGESDFWFEKYFIVLVISGIMAILILWQARAILRIVNKGNPFVNETVKRLRIIGIQSLVLAAFYFVSVFFVTKFFMVLVFVTFSIVGMILFVFAQIFEQAIAYKEENDMTI